MTEATMCITGAQHEIPASVDPLLTTILQWPRGHNTVSELRFRAWLAAQIASLSGVTVAYMASGCMAVVLEGARPSTTLFSCHMDTVDGHVPLAEDGSIQRKSLNYDPTFGLIGVDRGSVGNCLGADDGIGIWFMLKMLEARVPGGYIFHTGEEVGGIGSRAMLQNNKAFLNKFEVAVAFDRPRGNEVITHQGGQRCASDKMGKALSEALNKFGFDYAPSPHGSFTDTKVYRGVIAECLNLGVGYEHQHGQEETQDYAHAHALMKALIALDWAALPVDRDPREPDPVPVWQTRPLWDGAWRDTPAPKQVKSKKAKAAPPEYTAPQSEFESVLESTLDDLEYLCSEEPEQVAQTVMALAVEVGQLRAECAVLRALTRKNN